jgi:hypothetical protein
MSGKKNADPLPWARRSGTQDRTFGFVGQRVRFSGCLRGGDKDFSINSSIGGPGTGEPIFFDVQKLDGVGDHFRAVTMVA